MLIGGLASVLAAGMAFTALALSGVPLPGHGGHGAPAGWLLLVPVVYAALAVLFAAAADGVLRGQRWAWPLAVTAAVATLVLGVAHPIFMGHLTPDAIAAVLAAVTLALLCAPAGRTTLRPRP